MGFEPISLLQARSYSFHDLANPKKTPETPKLRYMPGTRTRHCGRSPGASILQLRAVLFAFGGGTASSPQISPLIHPLEV